MLIPSLRQILPLFLILVTTTKIADSSHSQLANIDRSIKSLSNSVSSLCPEKKYTLRFDGHATVEVFETVKIPSKKETSIPALLRVNRSLFVTVSGEEVFRVS